MGFRLTALGLKIVLIAFVTALGGFGVWVAAAVSVASFWVGSDTANSLNAVLSFGLVGGLAAAWIGPRFSGTWRIEAAGVAAALAFALLGAWFGSQFLDDVLVKPGAARFGPPGIPEAYGAVAGALLGSIAMPIAVGAYRVAKHVDP